MHARFTKFSTAALLTASLLVSGAASAQASIDDRQSRQRHRIHKGIQEGDLIRPEADRLKGEQQKIAKAERRFRHSGDAFSRRERRKVHHLLDRSAKHIRMALNNDRSR